MIITLPTKTWDVDQSVNSFASVLEQVISAMMVMRVGNWLSAGDPNSYYVKITRVGMRNYSIVGSRPGETLTHTNLEPTQAFTMFVTMFPIVWNRHDPALQRNTPDGA